jgi:hypothetical protein
MYRPHRPKWRLVAVHPPKGISEPAEVVFEVTNPNAFSLPMAAIRSSLRTGEKVLAEVVHPPADPIGPGQTREVTLSVRLSAAALADLLLAKARGGAEIGLDVSFDFSPNVSLRDRSIVAEGEDAGKD